MMSEDAAALLKMTGPELFWEIYDRFGGEQIYLPLGCIDHAVSRYLAANPDVPVRRLARSLHRTSRSIQRLRPVKPSEYEQQDLFDNNAAPA